MGWGWIPEKKKKTKKKKKRKKERKKKESGPVAELGTGSPVISVDERSSPRRYPLVLPSHCCVSFFLPFFAYLFFSLSLSSKKKQNKKKSQRRRRKRTGIWRLRFTSRPRALGCCLQTVNCLDYRQERERERKVCINVCAYKYSDWVLSVYLHASGHPSKRRAAPHGATRRTILLKLCWRCFELVYQKPLLLFSFLSSRLSTQVWTIPEPLLLLLLLLLWGRIILLAISLPTFITLLF